MKRKTSDQIEFQIGKEFRDRALELFDETQSLQFAEGLRLGSAMGNVHAREHKRLEKKYGKEHPLTLEMAERVEANEKAKKVLFARYTDASIPKADPGEGWAVDGFVRTEDLAPVANLTVAAYDRRGRWYQELGYSCTSEQGYFSITVEDISDKAPRPIYLRASIGEKLLESNEVRLSPAPRVADRVEIIIGASEHEGDCGPPSDGKGEPRPPDSSDREKEGEEEQQINKVPGRPDKEKKAAKDSSRDKTAAIKEEEINRKESREEERKKALEEEREKATEKEQKKSREGARKKINKKGFKRYGGRNSKRKGPKKRR